eukprot:GFUD01017425.1.p1 GENE.GFUD01017425.1~~GFUD01017425.1.p1  ORF type:complete len:131 (-),score=21.55 GFUD01017425.1:206-598(-)
MDGQMFFQTLLQSKSSNAPIQFNGSDETNCFPVKGSEVNIVTSEGDHDVGSSKLKIKNIVNFGWEHKYYPRGGACANVGPLIDYWSSSNRYPRWRTTLGSIASHAQPVGGRGPLQFLFPFCINTSPLLQM